ncbi:peptidase, S41 family [Treponema vincentii ATCC 35580]|uniref:Peptidase, S41 family n=1 Tax=Treponema vincentii ATCC 35580 TaxID=596324 RepID=C8PQK4_9SPIR|nr:S41 family peptidase [Treponema vincentii]EEV20359.1 peptidase, S41 family [Treponema vincentii ATCC 35580]
MKPRKIWIITCLFSVILISTASYAPSIFAQSQQDQGQSTIPYMQYLQYLNEALQRYYVDEVNPEVLFQGAAEGMLNALKDPYTMYIDNSSLTGVGLQDTTTGYFGGIGITFTKPTASTAERPSYIEVASALEGTPAWKAGIQADDLITEIEGESTVEMTQADVVAKLRGKIGSSVTVTVRRGKNMEFPAKLVRARIEVPTIKSMKLTSDIGYIRLIEFNPNSCRRIREAIEGMQAEGVTKLVLDLRNNPGGLITAAVDTASLFIKEGVIVSTKSRIPQQNLEFNTNVLVDAEFANVPLVVLINKGSASASEILAGALKDYKRAYLVGETSYGKGSVQQIFDLTQKDSFKMTISRYYTPSDANIDKTGIKPDKEVLLFPALSADDEKNLEKLFKDEKLADFVKNNKDLTATQITRYAETLAKEYSLNKELLRILIRQEYNRTHTAPAADIEYDAPLKEAVKILKSGTLPQLLKNSKTVRQMQEEAAAEESAAEAKKAS